jgi:putative transposase
MIQASTGRQGQLGIEQPCALAGVFRSGYYWHWQASAPREVETSLRDAIQRLSLANRRLGYRPITAMPKRDGWVVNHKRVDHLRATDNLLCLRKPSFRPATTNGRHRFEVYPNLARTLISTAMNQLWVADLTYVPLAEALVYLAVILGAFSRRVIGWALGRISCEPNWRWRHRKWHWRHARWYQADWCIIPIAACYTRAATTFSGSKRRMSSRA